MSKGGAAVRLQASLLDEARRLADHEGVGLAQLVNTALAEKLSAIRTESYFRERTERADVATALAILERAGRGRPPETGDDLYAPAGEARPKIS
jgi:hypothetical protein